MLLLSTILPACVLSQPRTLPKTGADASAPAPENATAAEAALDAPVIWHELGLSVQRRPLRTATFGKGPRKVLWVGGIHGDEREGAIATAELPRAFRSHPGAAAAVTLTILEDANPDGTALKVRWNANAVDLNRNYPAQNFVPDRRFGKAPLSQPESKLLHDLILELRPDLVIVAHSWRGDHFINFDGPPAARAMAELFSRLSGYRVRDSGDFSATPGSLGSWVGGELGIPILTLEYLRGRNPYDAWQETRAAILAVIVGR